MTLHVHLGGNNPCRRFSLLGIAHPVGGKYFQVLEVHREMKHIWDPSGEEGRIIVLLCFVKLWAENPVSVYVMRKSCNKTHFCMIYIV